MLRKMTFRRVLGAVALGFIALGAISSCSYLDLKQREWIFRAQKTERTGYETYAQGVQEKWLAIPGTEERLHAWWWPAEGAGAPTALYLHGTRSNLTGNASRIARLREAGFNVLAIDYRGFGRSSGEVPEEKLTYQDAEVAWAHLRSLEPNPGQRFIYGHSLGGAVGIELATRINDATGLILESTFTSIRDMAAVSAWGRWLPVGLILTQHFDSRAKIAKVGIPVFFMHGVRDRFVPSTMSETLFSEAREPKELWLVEGASHFGVAGAATDEYSRRLTAFIAQAQRNGSTRAAALSK
jgi:uncharacterized protein